MIKSHQTSLIVPAILTATCLLILLNLVLFSGFTANSKSNMAFFNENDIIGVKLSDGSGAQQLFAGFQKGPSRELEIEDATDYPAKVSLMQPANYRQRNYRVTLMGFSIRVRIFSFRQTPPENKFRQTGRNDGITHLTYVYEKCSRDKIVLLNHDDAVSINEVEEIIPIGRFGVVIQLLEK